MTESISYIENVYRIFDNGNIRVLNGITLDISRGEHVSIMGPSGSGKSTLLHIISGLDRPTKGKVFFNGFEPLSVKQWTKIRAKHIGFVFQEYFLLSTLTALENVQVPMFGIINNLKERKSRALELLNRVGLSDRFNHFPFQLSGGERQRVAIARSLANSPDLILADEPSGNLDSKTTHDVMNLLKHIYATEKTTLVVVTHDKDIASYADRLIKIIDGKIDNQ